MTSHSINTIIHIRSPRGRLHLGKLTDQQHFYGQLNDNFLILDYIRRDVHISEAGSHVSLKETTLLFSPIKIQTWCHWFWWGPAQGLKLERSIRSR